MTRLQQAQHKDQPFPIEAASKNIADHKTGINSASSSPSPQFPQSPIERLINNVIPSFSMHHSTRSSRTHLGARLPLLALWSSPPRAALPARHRAAVINIVILTAVQTGPEGHWCILLCTQWKMSLQRSRK